MRDTALPRNYRRGLHGSTALASAATLTAMTAILAVGSPPAQAALTHGPGATTPDAISSSTLLNGVSAVSATSAWAVGQYTNSSNSQAPLLLRWNGTKWAKVTVSAPSGSQGADLNGVSTDSATDAWAVGTVSNTGPAVPFLLHWNGTKWAKVTSPTPSGAENTFLYGVSAVSATDAWAAGYYDNSSGVDEPFLLHWNGTAWSRVTSPVPSGAKSAGLSGVSADSATDAWASGSYTNRSGVSVPLLLHWNGTKWKVVTSPTPSGGTSLSLTGVSAVSVTDAWAAGDYYNSSGVTVPLTLHWNGTTWKVVKSPAPSTDYNPLSGVSADSATDAWAAGYYINSDSDVPLTLHWNGTAWTKVTSPAPTGAMDTQLSGVSAVSATDAWAVGSYYNGSGFETVTLHWNGTAWKKVTSPNGT